MDNKRQISLSAAAGLYVWSTRERLIWGLLLIGSPFIFAGFETAERG